MRTEGRPAAPLTGPEWLTFVGRGLDPHAVRTPLNKAPQPIHAATGPRQGAARPSRTASTALGPGPAGWVGVCPCRPR